MTSPLDRFRAPIERALVSGGDTHRFEDLVSAVESGAMQAWPGAHSILVTEIVNYPSGRRDVNFVLAAGDRGGSLEEIRAMYPIVLEWAREAGCTRATFAGRDGWARTFLTKEAGWTPTLRVFAKDL